MGAGVASVLYVGTREEEEEATLVYQSLFGCRFYRNLLHQ